MKTNYFKAICTMLFAVFTVVQTVNAQTEPQYVIIDLATGETIDVVYDVATYRTMNRGTNAPVEFYVINSKDTVHGLTGLIVNNMLVRDASGVYRLDEGKIKMDGDELKMKMADGRKVKWENGKMKIKDWKGKYKVKDDKTKMKDQWTKVKWKDVDWNPEMY